MTSLDSPSSLLLLHEALGHLIVIPLGARNTFAAFGVGVSSSVEIVVDACVSLSVGIVVCASSSGEQLHNDKKRNVKKNNLFKSN